MFVRAISIVFFALVAIALAADVTNEKVISKRDTSDAVPLDISSPFDVAGLPKSADTQLNSPSSSPQDRWCQLTENIYVPKGYTFMKDTCTYCQCALNRKFLCGKLPCMNAFCVDDSAAAVPNGQCCARCSYEQGSSFCNYKNLTIPHGGLVRRTATNIYCWCQFGSIECRQVTLGDNSGFFGDGTTVYIVVIVVCLLILLGTLLCGGCSLLAYYYYRQNQMTAQTAAEQYWNNAGWQPMEDGETPAEEKEAEAQKNVDVNEYPNGNATEYIPPPYAMYNGPYASEEKQN